MTPATKNNLRKPARETARQKRRRMRLMGLEPRPSKGVGEMYVTGGSRFHSTWCAAVNGVWLSGAQTLRVVPLAQVRHMAPCSLCEPQLCCPHCGEELP